MKILPLLVVLAGGCVVDEEVDELEYGEDVSEVQTTNRISLNKISLNGMAQASLREEAQRPGSLMATASGRELMSYVVSCALPAGRVATFVTATGTYVYPGAIGLAPNWWTVKPTTAERKWVSSCLLARTNRFGITVPISLRGNHAALTPTAEERRNYPLFEGTFWGDVFDPNGTLNACVGALKTVNGVTGGLLGITVSSFGDRDCAISDDGKLTRCGFTYRGSCALANPPAEAISSYLLSVFASR